MVVELVLAQEVKEGVVNSDGSYYAYKQTIQPNGNTRYVVVDCTMVYINSRSLMATLFFTYIACVLLTFVLSIPVAERFIRPAEEAWENQKTLVTNASHELKTPLTIIDTNMAAIKNETDPEIINKWMRNVTDQTSRMNILINEMLELARLDDKADIIEFSDIDVSEVIKGVSLSFEAALFEKHILYNADITDNIVINTNKALLEKIIFNLTENAYKYTAENGNMEIKLYRNKKNVIYSIRNSGEGIPEEKLKKVFDRFYRTDTARSQNSSNSFGLGLSIAQSIANRLGAVLTAESIVGSYTEFKLTF